MRGGDLPFFAEATEDREDKGDRGDRGLIYE